MSVTASLKKTKSHLVVNRLTYNITRAYIQEGNRLDRVCNWAGKKTQGYLPNYNLGGLRNLVARVEDAAKDPKEQWINPDIKHLIARNWQQQSELPLENILDDLRLEAITEKPIISILKKSRVPLFASIGVGLYFGNIITETQPTGEWPSATEWLSIAELFIGKTKSVSAAITTTIAGGLAIGLIPRFESFLSKFFPNDYLFSSEERIANSSCVKKYYKYFLAIIGSPTVEEGIFRWGTQGFLLKIIDPISAIILQGVIFSFMHPKRSRPELISCFTSGLILGSAYYLSGSLVIPILLHAAINIHCFIRYNHNTE